VLILEMFVVLPAALANSSHLWPYTGVYVAVVKSYLTNLTLSNIEV
jgi:hypothetical protein